MPTYPGGGSGGGGGGGDMDAATYDPFSVADDAFNPAFHALGGTIVGAGDSPYDIQGDEQWIAVDTGLGPVTLNLPLIDALTGQVEERIFVYCSDNSNDIFFKPKTGEVVDGGAPSASFLWQPPAGAQVELIGVPIPGSEWLLIRSAATELFADLSDPWWGGADNIQDALENFAASDGSNFSDVAANTAALAIFTLSPQHIEFAADGGNSIEARISFPGPSTEVEAIYVGPIGADGTGTMTFEKGMQGGTDLTASTLDVSGLTTDTLEDINDLHGTQANYQGGPTDVVLVTAINCDVPHLVKITFKRQ
jgi:hypothetical protein